MSQRDSDSETYANFRRWQSGEYRYCRSFNLSEHGVEPQLDCDTALNPPWDLPVYDHGKTFKVRFVGAPTYDSSEKENSERHWNCRRTNDSNVMFVCTAIRPQE